MTEDGAVFLETPVHTYCYYTSCSTSSGSCSSLLHYYFTHIIYITDSIATTDASDIISTTNIIDITVVSDVTTDKYKWWMVATLEQILSPALNFPLSLI